MKILIEFETDEEYGKVNPQKFYDELVGMLDEGADYGELRKVVKSRLVKKGGRR